MEEQQAVAAKLHQAIDMQGRRLKGLHLLDVKSRRCCRSTRNNSNKKLIFIEIKEDKSIKIEDLE